MIRAEIITIGDEILIGQILDTNSQWIAEQLDMIGIKVTKMASIADDRQAITNAIVEGTTESDVLIFTGGLGPTKDDITKHTFCEFFKSELVLVPEHMEQLRHYFESRNRPMNALNESQAYIPSNSELIPNPVGTAPGMWFSYNNTIIVSLPGVPHEMKSMMEETVLDRLRLALHTEAIAHHTLQTIGIGESDLAIKIEHWENTLPPHIKLAYLPNLGKVRLRLSGTHVNKTQLQQELEHHINQLKPLIDLYLFGEGNDTIEAAVGRLLVNQNATVSTAESCTGGYLAHQLTKVPGSSAYFKGSIIAYDNDIKKNELNVSPIAIEKEGAVSEEVVKQMAISIRKKYNTTYGLACSGVAGPSGGTLKKPVGLVWMALSTPTETIVKCRTFPKGRLENIQLTATYMLNMLRQSLISNSGDE